MEVKSCKYNPDKFCYICGVYIFDKTGHPLSDHVKYAYSLYFNCTVENQDEQWCPHVCCGNCKKILSSWINNKKVYFSFSTPMQWREPRSHKRDCYFCCTIVPVGANKRKKNAVEYADVRSVTKPIPRNSKSALPTPPIFRSPTSIASSSTLDMSSSTTNTTTSGSDFIPEGAEPHLVTQAELNDLVRDLELSKDKSELLGSRLAQWRLLAAGYFEIYSEINEAKPYPKIILLFRCKNNSFP